MNRGVAIMTAVGVILVTGLVVSLTVVATNRAKRKREETCSTPLCVETANKIINNMDRNVKPCDNFYKFACGGYLASAPIPDGDISVDPISAVGKDVEKQLRTVIEEPGKPNEARNFRLAKYLYKTCMNTSALEKAGVKPIRKVIEQLGGWPVVEGDNWREDDFDWVKSVYKSRELGYMLNNFIALSITTDWKNTSNYILVLDQPMFGISREFLMEGIEYFVVKAYYDYMVDVAVLLGADRVRATRELRESLDFEMKLVNISLPDEERRNYTLLNNQMTIEELNKQYPIVDWEEYINKLLPPTVRVNTSEVIMVKEPRFITDLGKLLKNTPKRVQANYALWRIVADSAKYLTKAFSDRKAQFDAAMMGNGASIVTPRWKDCLKILTSSTLSLSSSALYVRRYFKEEARQNVVEMVDNIKRELLKNLEAADWMDDRTKSMALAKATSMIAHIAYPVELLDDQKLIEIYAKLEFTPNDFLGNVLRLNHLDIKYIFEFLRKPVNRSEWITHDYSTEVNAMYDANENSVQIPAAVLQGAFFSNDRPRYMNFGGMGFLIGHEMTHSFDAEGRQFDKDGNLVDWWTPETAEKYLQRAKCIINQYSNYTVESVKLNVNGENTVSENIADNGGVKLAYYAYKDWVKRNGPEARLPNLEYTPEQMFWISSANIWCSRYRPEFAHYELTTDVHSPERFRVIGSLSNMPEFAADFNCPKGSYMNPVHKCSVV